MDCKKEKEKCCALCKHCTVDNHYLCRLVSRRDRITGRIMYKECTHVIDTDDCKFEPTKFNLSFIISIISIALLVIIFGDFIISLF